MQTIDTASVYDFLKKLLKFKDIKKIIITKFKILI